MFQLKVEGNKKGIGAEKQLTKGRLFCVVNLNYK